MFWIQLLRLLIRTMLQDGLGPAKGWSGDRLGNGLAASAD